MKAFNKDIVRSIRHSLGRFVAIAAIVALGCGFYAGLRMTAPDMKLAADAYYDGTDLMDIRVVSTLGLTDEDIEALRDVPGVSGVEAAYSADVLATLNDEQYVMRVHSLSPSAATAVKVDEATISSDDANYLNRLDLVEGRWPESADECVIFNDRVMSGPTGLGDTVTVDPSVGNVEDTLATTEFTVVGRVHSPLYVSSTSMGTSTIGSGTIEQFMYVLPEAFDPDMPYVEAYVSVEGAAELPADSDAYDDKVAGVVAAIEGIAPAREEARVDGLKAEAQADLDEARAEYEEEEARAKTELADARAELDSAKEELDEGQRKLDAAASTLAANEKKIKDGEKEYTQGTESLSKRKADAEAQFAEAERQIAANEANLAEANAALPTLQDALAQAEAALQVPNLPADQRAELEATRADLEQKIADIGSAEVALEEAKAQLAQQCEAADAQIAAAQAQLDAAKTSVEEGKKQLEEGKAEYEQAKADLEAGRAEYEQGVADYDAAAAEANEKLDAAEQELADAQEDIDNIEPPDWFVMDRTKNFGVVSFASDADRIDAIASFFPFIFFLVAALVALTTMTRMVEEERMLIGTFKALGYSRARITSKYLIYAALAAGAGSVIGIAVLSQVLPWVIMEAYSIVYYVPRGAMPIDWPIALAAAGLGIGITLLATWAAAAATLRETPAALMQPPAPKAGKRILLEHIGPLWRHLSFSWKVTFRNIFRYKRRLVMTVIGIAGCTALLLTGLGLQNSINDIIDVQYGELVHYNAVVDRRRTTCRPTTTAASRRRPAGRHGFGAGGRARHARAERAHGRPAGTDKAPTAMTTVVAPVGPGRPCRSCPHRPHRARATSHVALADAGAVARREAGDRAGPGRGRCHRCASPSRTSWATPRTTTYDRARSRASSRTTSATTPSSAPGDLRAHLRGRQPDIPPRCYARAELPTPGSAQALSTRPCAPPMRGGDRGLQRRGHRRLQVRCSSASGHMVVVGARGGRGGARVHRCCTTSRTSTSPSGPREIATLEGARSSRPREVSAYIYRETMLLSGHRSGARVGPRALGVVHGGLRRGDGRGGPGHVRPHHPLGQLRHRVCAHHGVHRHRHARHAPQTRPHRHGGEPEVQRVRLCDLENVPKWTRFAQSNLARFKKAHFPGL